MITRKNFFKCTLFTVGIFVVNAASALQQLDGIAVIVNDDVITNNEIKARTNDFIKKIKASNLSARELIALRKQVTERMVRDKVQLQHAGRLGIKIDDVELNRMLERLAQSNGLSLEKMRKTIEADGLPFSRFREQSRDELIIKQLQQRMVASKVNVTDQEVEQFIANKQNKKSRNVKYKLRHILIGTPEAASPEDIQQAKIEAEKIAAEISKGASFEKLAINQSDGRNALKGGDLGWRKADELPESFTDAIEDLNTGGTSEIIRSASGFHLLKLENKSSGSETVMQTHARHILIRTGAKTSDDAARKTLLSLKIRVNKGEKFEDLAAKYSQDPGSKKTGGDLGWASPGAFVSAFENVMGSLKNNQISEPFKSQFGWHIIQVLERRKRDITQANIQADARRSIHQRKADEELQLWLRRIRDEAYVEYVDKNLSPGNGSR